MKKLIGRTDVEDALRRLDKLTHDEAQMATVEVLKATHAVNDRVAAVAAKVAEVIDGTQSIFFLSVLKKETFDRRATRRKRSEGSHATNSRRCGPNQTFVVS